MKLPIVERAKIKSAMLRMGEPIAFGSDADLIDEQARIIEALAEALESFADQCTYSEDTHDASDCEISVKLFELRRARAALAMAKGE